MILNVITHKNIWFACKTCKFWINLAYISRHPYGFPFSEDDELMFAKFRKKFIKFDNYLLCLMAKVAGKNEVFGCFWNKSGKNDMKECLLKF